MKRLWGRWWFRVPACLVISPVIMSFGFLASAFAYDVIRRGMVYDSSVFSIPPTALLYVAIGAEVLTVFLVVVMEAGNRQRGRPLPPGICAAYVAIYSVFMVVAAALMTKIGSGPIFFDLPWLSPLLVLAAPALVAFGLTLPMIRAWQAKGIRPEDASNLF